MLDRQHNVPIKGVRIHLDPGRPTYDYGVSGLTNTQCIHVSEIGDRSKLILLAHKRGNSEHSADVGPALAGNIKALL